MFEWKNRKYVNPRKRIFKNLDTGEMLNLELQDDPDNILEESDTPLIDHNLNLAQDELVDDMSKTYTGTNITAPTVAGFGTINKLYGHTVEEGTGEKSPSNPYTLKCVADDVNLFDEKFRLGGSGQVVTDGTAVNRLYNVQNLYLEAGKTYAFSTDLDIATYRWAISIFPNQLPATVAGTYDSGWKQQKEFSFTPSQSGYFGIGLSRADNANLTVSNISQYHFKLQKGSVATPWSPYGKGTVEIISKNGDNQSSNICYVKGGLAEDDYIDYGLQKVIRANGTKEPLDCSNKIVQYGEQTTVYNRDGAKIEVSLTNNEAISGLNENIGNVENIVNKMSNYTLEEQIIGTWTNGKPLYKKVFEWSGDEKQDFVDTLAQNIDMAILIGGYIQGGGGSKMGIEMGGKYHVSVNTGGTMFFSSTQTERVRIVKYSLIIIYTKTTD